jgi:hypothetical protein
MLPVSTSFRNFSRYVTSFYFILQLFSLLLVSTSFCNCSCYVTSFYFILKLFSLLPVSTSFCNYSRYVTSFYFIPQFFWLCYQFLLDSAIFLAMLPVSTSFRNFSRYVTSFYFIPQLFSLCYQFLLHSAIFLTMLPVSISFRNFSRYVTSLYLISQLFWLCYQFLSLYHGSQFTSSAHNNLTITVLPTERDSSSLVGDAWRYVIIIKSLDCKAGYKLKHSYIDVSYVRLPTQKVSNQGQRSRLTWTILQPHGSLSRKCRINI